MGVSAKAHDPSACLREAEAASLRRRQVGEDADTSPASLGRKGYLEGRRNAAGR
jgi:hypothetical protein